MDLESLRCFAEVAKDLHITKAAGRLFISQQTLSSRLQRLEEYYGTRLLERKPTPALTPAGEQVLAFAKEVLRQERELRSILLDIDRQERGVIRFGASALRMNHSVPHILPSFAARYPNVRLHLTNHNSAKLEQMVRSGELDFALVLTQGGGLYCEDPGLTYRHLIDDRICLCVSELLLERCGIPEDQRDRTAVSAGDFPRLPYCIYENSIGRQVQACFEEAGIKPQPFLTDENASAVSISACCQGLAACFLSQTHLAELRLQLPEHVRVYPLVFRGGPVAQSLYLISEKGRYLPRFAEDFADLIAAHFSSLKVTEK